MPFRTSGPIVRDGVLGAALNAELRALVLRLSQSSPGQQSNMASGRSYFRHKWLSPKDLHQRDEPVLQAVCAGLRQQAETACQELLGVPQPLTITACWALVSRQGMAGRPHSHQGLISGAYYVDAGASGAPGCGGLFLTWPGGSGTPQQWQPRTDRLLLFASALAHAVSPYQAEQPRITLSFNLDRRDGGEALSRDS
ncbi:MAG: putative 2OG-Fe(II) oxygenase [Cyanobium sp.]